MLENFRLKRISYEKSKNQVLFLTYKINNSSVRLNFTESNIKNCEINQENLIDILLNLKIRTDYINFKPKHKRRNKFIYFCNNYVKKYRKNRLKLNKDLLDLKNKLEKITFQFRLYLKVRVNHELIKKYNYLRNQIKQDINENFRIGDNVVLSNKCSEYKKRKNIELCECGDDCFNRAGALDDNEIGIVKYISENYITIENPFLITYKYEFKDLKRLLFFEKYVCIKKMFSLKKLTKDDIKEINRVCSFMTTLVEKRKLAIKYFIDNLKKFWENSMEPSESSIVNLCRYKNLLPIFQASIKKEIPDDLLSKMKYNLNDISMLERIEHISNKYKDVKECSICFYGVYDKLRTKLGENYYCNTCLINHFVHELKSSKINCKGLSYPDGSDFISPLKLKSTFGFLKKRNKAKKINLTKLINQWLERLILNTKSVCLCPNSSCVSKKKLVTGKYFINNTKELYGCKIKINKKNYTIVDISNGKNKCGNCKMEICTTCYKHSTNVSCEIGKTLYELNNNKNTTLCPNCGRLIFRTGGCDHITCRFQDKNGDYQGCGADFCFKCGLLGSTEFKCPGPGKEGHRSPIKITEKKLKLLEI